MRAAACTPPLANQAHVFTPVAQSLSGPSLEAHFRALALLMRHCPGLDLEEAEMAVLLRFVQADLETPRGSIAFSLLKAGAAGRDRRQKQPRPHHSAAPRSARRPCCAVV